jgi:splicing factor 3B subunit 2
MGLSAAEKNRRKRERKRKEKEEQRRQLEEKQEQDDDAQKKSKEEENDVEIEIEYVAEDLPGLEKKSVKSSTTSETTSTAAAGGLPSGLPPPPGQENNDNNKEQRGGDESIEDVVRRFNQRALVVPTASSAVVSDDEKKGRDRGHDRGGSDDDDDERSDDDSDDDDENNPSMSKRKLRELMRPTVAELKRRVARPDLVEAHDITAADPDFLIALKAVPGTARVPRHWGRKRKYLQGKRGYEKPPFKLPDFIVKTGITEIRDTLAEDEAKQSAKQKNRGRVNPKMGNMDVDYGVLYEAFFKYQTKPTDLTKFGDLYYEGKELETSTDIKPGGPFSKALKMALGMPLNGNNVPPPWLLNMQRYGPPPSYPHLSIPGLNAPLPNDQCQYGYHPGGWGKPPVDAWGRPLYGGNPFDPPGSGKRDDNAKEFVTSDGKTVLKSAWGSLPTGDFGSGGFGGEDDDEGSMEESSSEDEGDMDESDAEEDTGATLVDGMESVLPPPPSASTTAPDDLRKQPAGDETPAPKRLYQVLETKAVPESQSQADGVFQSEVQYVVPGATAASAAKVPEGAESVLSKAMVPGESKSKKRKHNTEDDEGFDKNFKF